VPRDPGSPSTSPNSNASTWSFARDANSSSAHTNSATQKSFRSLEAVRAEGWTWVEIPPKLEYSDINKFANIEPKRQKASGEDSEALDKLNAKLEALIQQEQQNADDNESGVSSKSRAERHSKIERLETKIEEIEQKRLVWTKKTMALSGALIGITHGGNLEVRRG